MSGPSAMADAAIEPAQFLSDGHPINAVLANPDRMPPTGAPAILLLHEWWGLNGQIKEVARRFAEAGYVALVPDLYSRQSNAVTDDPAKAAALMQAISAQQILRDLNAGTKYLKTRSVVDPLRIGVAGFSMGGTFALTQACHNSDLKACVSFYGKVPPLATFRYLLCPVLYHAAGRDGWVTKQEVELLSQAREQHGKAIEVCVYPDAPHAFFNETWPEVYRAEDARTAWERTLVFFKRHL